MPRAALAGGATNRKFEAGPHKAARYFTHLVDRAAKTWSGAWVVVNVGDKIELFPKTRPSSDARRRMHMGVGGELKSNEL